MTSTGERARRRKLLVRGVGWCFCLGLWTVGLLTTRPVEVSHAVMPHTMHYPASKSLHICAYAFLTLYISWLPLRRWRWLLLAILSLHAAGTEFCQQFIPGRTGMVSDVLLDHVGLILGLSLAWKRWAPHHARRLLLGLRVQE